MLIISKKRIQIVVGCIILALITCSLPIAKQKQNHGTLGEETKNSITTTATPVSGKTIVIDAGHRCTR